MLSGSVEPKKMGVYMGIFNMFIVIPQIVAALGGVNFLYKLIFGEAVIHTMLLAGTLLILAGLCNLFITDRHATHD
jgi:maltose/moltooligosaccharide transporter